MKRMSFLLLVILISCSNLSAQASQLQDTIPADTLAFLPAFSTPSAWTYVNQVVSDDNAWRSQKDPLREQLGRLLDHTLQPYDTTRSRLLEQDFSVIEMHTANPVQTDTVEIKWLNDSTFLVDPQGWSSSLYHKQFSKLVYPVDLSTLELSDSILDESGMLDSALFTPDTVMVTELDTAALSALEIHMHHIRDNRVEPPLTRAKDGSIPFMSDDSSRIHYYQRSTAWKADEDSPFHILSSRYKLDSLQFAMEKLLVHNQVRDSTLLYINDVNGQQTPFWLTTGNDEAYRFWIKNFNNDSITIWLGNPGTGQLSLLLEDDVNFSRLVKEDFQHLPTFVEEKERSLFTMKMLEPEPIFWDYGFLSAFVLNQTYLSNWTKGGESSFSTMMDLQGEATYNNKENKTQWINSTRLKFGTIQTSEKGFRKNHDALEINSKFNRNAWGKIGMSASFYMKNQLAKGYDYPNDSIPVSKFLNPGTMTLGLGVEYKPFKDMNINLAPLSYKTTFVFDTAQIDQTLHGVDEDDWAKREMGFQAVVISKFKPFENMEINNKLRLFSNYLDKPQNVDVDWEVIVNQKINWFFTIRLNLHLIYDDDVQFPVLDSEGSPIMLPDGSEKKVSKMQFKEFVGLSLQFKF